MFHFAIAIVAPILVGSLSTLVSCLVPQKGHLITIVRFLIK